MPVHVPLPPRYHVRINGDNKGPYTLAHMQTMWRRKEITSDTLCWLEGEEDWRPVADLQPKLEPRSREAIEEIREARRPGAGGGKRGKGKAFRSLFLLFLVIALIVGFVVGIVMFINSF